MENVFRKIKARFVKKRALRPKRSKSEKIVHAVFFTVMLLWCAAIVYVYLYGFNASLKESGRVFVQDPNSFASELNFGNYVKAFKEMTVNKNSYFMMTFNSVWYSVGGTLFSLSVAACSTYVVARFKNKFTKTIFNICILVMIFPVVGAGPALYRLYHDLHINQTPFILLSGLNNMCNLIMYAFFSALPQTYAEAAYLDGANDFQVFFRIMLPMAIPSISVLFVTGVVASWNDWATPMLYLNRSFPTLASGLYVYERRIEYLANQPVYFAGVVLAMIPPIILYSVMQNTIMSKVYFGGLKG